MDVFQFVLLRESGKLMTAAELERARALAAKADAGSERAAQALRTLVESVLWGAGNDVVDMERAKRP